MRFISWMVCCIFPPCYLVYCSLTCSGIAWIEFLNSTDILGDVLTHLREGDMRGAQLLWLRYEVIIRKSFVHTSTAVHLKLHFWNTFETFMWPWCVILQGQIALEFEEKSLEAVLGAIPEDLLSQDLCPWLRTVFVPFVRRVLPRGQVEWLHFQIKKCAFLTEWSLFKLNNFSCRESWLNGLSWKQEIWS